MSEASKDPAAPATTSAQIVAASTEKEAVGQLNIRPESGQTPVVSAPQTANVADPKMTSAPTVERARQPEVLPELAVKSVRLMVSDGLEKLSVRLSPPSLGELHLEVTSSPDGGLQVRLLSGNAGVRDALQGQLPLLREALDRAGFQTAAVTVAPDVSGGAMSGHYLYNQGNGAAQEQQGQLPYHSEKLAREPDTPGARREWAHQGTLNLLA
jgi:flagellar hook-length control protein FliK